MSKHTDTAYFMGVDMPLASKTLVLEAIDQASRHAPISIATLNPEFMLDAQRNLTFRTSLSSMSFATIDGFGLLLMLRFWKFLCRRAWKLELYHGSDMVTDLFRRYQDGKKSFFFLGGPPGLVEKAQAQARKQFPGLQIVGAESGGVIPSDNIKPDPNLILRIEKSQPDILLVGFGSPKQEIWIQQARQLLSVPVIIGVGGSLGFYSVKKRAPHLFQVLHLEWLYRALREKGHWRRAWRAVAVFPLHAFLWMGKSLASRGNETK